MSETACRTSISSSRSLLSAEALKHKALELGFTTVGITSADAPEHAAFLDAWLGRGFQGEMGYMARNLNVRRDLTLLLPGARSVVAVTLNYNQPNPAVEGMPRIAKYALGRDYHKVLKGKLRQLSAWVGSEYPGAVCRPCVDSAPILEREFANRAGLGWFGKNSMLIDSKRGSWFFIGLLLTTAPFESDKPAIGGCGTCRKCIDACPTGAIVLEDERWQVDARKCISYQTIELGSELTEKLYGWTFGCDVCQEVCPFNDPSADRPEKAALTTEKDFLRRREWPSLVQLAQLNEGDWNALTQGSAVRRTGLDGIKRNADANLTVSK